MSGAQLVTVTYSLDGDKDLMVTFDASINEQHSGEAQVTEHPVESGPNITDNIRPTPLRLSLEVMVTNTPVYAGVLPPSTAQNGMAAPTSFVDASGKTHTGTSGLTFADEFDRVRDVTDALVAAMKGGALCTVVTTLATYQNMAIVNLAIPRNAESGNAVRITIDMQEVVLVDVVTVDTLSAKHQEKNRGNQPLKQDTPAQTVQKKESMAHGGAAQVFQKISSWLGFGS